MSSKVECIAWLGDVVDQKKVVWAGATENLQPQHKSGEISQKNVRVRTSSDHKIDLFSLGKDGIKDANVGMDSLKFVYFVC